MPLPALHASFWPACVVVALVGVGFVPHSFFFGATDWERVYLPAAHRLRDGEPLFRQAFVYPPAAVLLPLPASYLPASLQQSAFWLMQTAFGSVLLAGGWVLTGGRFQFLPPPREAAVAIVGLIAGIGFVFDVMVNRQNDLVIGGLVVGGCLLLRRERGVAGGVAIGLAAGMKCTPLLFVPYLAWVGRWRAAVAVAATAVAANVAPDVLFPPADGTPRLLAWAKNTFAVVGKASGNPGDWHADIGYNHSLAGVATRVTTTTQIEVEGRWRTVPTEPQFPPLALRLTVYGFALILFGVAAWVTRPLVASSCHPLDLGLVLCLMVLMSPMSSKPHFAVLVVPGWALARAAADARSPLLWATAVLAALLALPANKDLVGGWLYDHILWHGVVAAEALVLFAGCAVARSWLPARPSRRE